MEGCNLDHCKADHVPEGFRKLTGATTAPIGWVWYGKGSRFIRHDYEHVLVTVEESERYERGKHAQYKR